MNKYTIMMGTATCFATLLSGIGPVVAEPAPVRDSFHEHKSVTVFRLEDTPACPIAPGTITAVETAVGHLAATGVDVGDPNDPNDDTLVGPARLSMNLTSKVTYVPDDPSLATLSGHSGQHFAWNVEADGIGVARAEAAIVLKGADGSRFTLHHVGRAVYDVSQANSPNEGLVDVIWDKVRCG